MKSALICVAEQLVRASAGAIECIARSSPIFVSHSSRLHTRFAARDRQEPARDNNNKRKSQRNYLHSQETDDADDNIINIGLPLRAGRALAFDENRFFHPHADAFLCDRSLECPQHDRIVCDPMSQYR